MPTEWDDDLVSGLDLFADDEADAAGEEVSSPAPTKTAQVVLNVRQSNFTDEVKKRKNGVHEEGFDMDAMLFENQIKSAPWPNELEMRKEIETWNYHVPPQHAFDRAKITIAYSRLNRYRERLGSMMATATKYEKITGQAYKSLKETAMALYGGIEKERLAHASYRTRPFELEHLYALSVLAFLTETGKTLDAMFFNLATLLKHIDNLGFVNRGYDNEGISNQFTALSDGEEEGQNEGSDTPTFAFNNALSAEPPRSKSATLGRIRTRVPVSD